MLNNFKSARVISLVLVFSILQIYVQASLIGPAAKVNSSGAQDSSQVSGRLTTNGNKPITIDGNAAQNGYSVGSNVQITTPPDVGATVDFGPLGRIDIAPDSTITLTYTPNGLEVKVTKGCVNLTAGSGVNGSVQTAQGTTQQTDTSTRVVNACGLIAAGASAGSAGAGTAAVVTGATTGGIFSSSTLPLAIAVTAAIGVSGIAAGNAFSSDRGTNLSPGTP